MPIDTSSYYPEVKGPDDKEKEESLNGRHYSLFGETKNEDIDTDSEPEEPKVQKSENKKNSETKIDSCLNKIATAISWILMPLIMPVIGTIYIFKLSVLDVIPNGLQTAFTFIIAGINLCIPVLLILLLKLLGLVKDVGLNNQNERSLPYIITAICLGASAWFMGSRGAPVWVCMFYTGGAVAAIINMIINFKWKISAHGAAIAGLVALLIRLQRDVAAEPELFLWLLITVGAAGLLGTSRVWLGKHTVWQVLAGYVVGFCSVFFMMYIH